MRWPQWDTWKYLGFLHKLTQRCSHRWLSMVCWFQYLPPFFVPELLQLTEPSYGSKDNMEILSLMIMSSHFQGGCDQQWLDKDAQRCSEWNNYTFSRHQSSEKFWILTLWCAVGSRYRLICPWLHRLCYTTTYHFKFMNQQLSANVLSLISMKSGHPISLTNQMRQTVRCMWGIQYLPYSSIFWTREYGDMLNLLGHHSVNMSPVKESSFFSTARIHVKLVPCQDQEIVCLPISPIILQGSRFYATETTNRCSWPPWVSSDLFVSPVVDWPCLGINSLSSTLARQGFQHVPGYRVVRSSS